MNTLKLYAQSYNYLNTFTIVLHITKYTWQLCQLLYSIIMYSLLCINTRSKHHNGTSHLIYMIEGRSTVEKDNDYNSAGGCHLKRWDTAGSKKVVLHKEWHHYSVLVHINT